MRSSLDWMKDNDVESISAVVSAGNEDVFEFYFKYGFKPRCTELELIIK